MDAELQEFFKTLENIDLGLATDESIIPYSIGIYYGTLPSELSNIFINYILNNVNQHSYFSNAATVNGLPEIQNNVSRFGNISRNLIVLAALKKISSTNKHRAQEINQTILKLKKYIKNEFINNNQQLNLKTVGYELVINKFSTLAIPLFNLKILYIKFFALKRLLKYSDTLLFSIESLPYFVQKIIKKSILSNWNSVYHNSSYISNSGSLTLFMLKTLPLNNRSEIVDHLKKFNGIPLFFKSEIFELSLILDICLCLGINKKLFLNLVAQLDLPDMFDSKKGFPISKFFKLYDADTTALSAKILCALLPKESSTKYKNFNFEYYRKKDSIFYNTYYHDNRSSITTNAHILDFFSTNHIYRPELLNEILKKLTQGELFDKWNCSKIYVLFTISNSLSSFSNITESRELVVEVSDKIHQILLDLQAPSGGFSSIENCQDNIYETVWAVLTLKQLSRFINVQLSLDLAEEYLRARRSADEYLKFWLLNDTYSLIHVDNFIYKLAKLL